ncbi:hypothetical protein [Acanthopleuribacter pedis]|uniref:Uncharacterized protein n=1 Tax=Acanthopleuribacter pedis TaxID=442870 RepID=A0A8J7QHH4_9BACT|nr:hypothetical protein [Acanthopleuribacter pedis]MBO1317212.1 hypothetical protein [Acanthopleuribacter pedis]MBO1318518.1 hypothetical protein [Acanthopleuribacter pedis]
MVKSLYLLNFGGPFALAEKKFKEALTEFGNFARYPIRGEVTQITLLFGSVGMDPFG